MLPKLPKFDETHKSRDLRSLEPGHIQDHTKVYQNKNFKASGFFF